MNQEAALKKDIGLSVVIRNVIPIFAIIGSVYIVGGTIMNDQMDSLTAILITLAGLPVYYLLKKIQGDKQDSN